MAATRMSVAEARKQFARLIRSAERGKPVEITRRGEPVAVLLSAAEYLALTGAGPSFMNAVERVRARLSVGSLEIGQTEFEGLRDAGEGREVSL